jgi:integrase
MASSGYARSASARASGSRSAAALRVADKQATRVPAQLAFFRNLDGSQKTDGEADAAIKRMCRRAGLPLHGFHRVRHSFGTHAALFGVNPWRLQAWMVHKRIDETMLYVHVAEAHHRELPEVVRQAAVSEADPDARIIWMHGARGSHVAAEIEVTNAKTMIPAA